MRPPTALEVAAAQSGYTLPQLARKLSTSRARKTRRQLETAVICLQRVLRNGATSSQRSELYARRLAHLLGIYETPLHNLLLLPRTAWPHWATDGSYKGLNSLNTRDDRSVATAPGKALVTGTGVGGNHSRTTAPTLRKRPSPKEITVLEVL